MGLALLSTRVGTNLRPDVSFLFEPSREPLTSVSSSEVSTPFNYAPPVQPFPRYPLTTHTRAQRTASTAEKHVTRGIGTNNCTSKECPYYRVGLHEQPPSQRPKNNSTGSSIISRPTDVNLRSKVPRLTSTNQSGYARAAAAVRIHEV